MQIQKKKTEENTIKHKQKIDTYTKTETKYRNRNNNKNSKSRKQKIDWFFSKPSPTLEMHIILNVSM